MANLTENPTFDSTVYRIDQNDPVQGWDGSNIGISNQQAQALANRTQWLKARIDLGGRFTAFFPFAPATPGQVQPLTPAELKGQLIRVNTATADGALTLPPASTCEDGANVAVSVEPGAGVKFIASNGKFVVLSTSGGDTIYDIDTNEAVGTYTIHPYSLVRIHKASPTEWIVWKERAVEICPPGMISAWAVNSQPYGWLECNGSAISRTTYKRLFDNIGTQFGVGNGSTTFNIPDLRGEFIRGWDNGRGVDDNNSTQTASITNGSPNVTVAGNTTGLAVGMSVTGTGIPVGATIASITSGSVFVLSANATATNAAVTLSFSGRMFGSYQADIFKSHFHTMKKYNRSVGAGASFFAMDDNGTDGSENTELTGGDETRPRNISLMLCIKY